MLLSSITNFTAIKFFAYQLLNNVHTTDFKISIKGTLFPCSWYPRCWIQRARIFFIAWTDFCNRAQCFMGGNLCLSKRKRVVFSKHGEMYVLLSVFKMMPGTWPLADIEYFSRDIDRTAESSKREHWETIRKGWDCFLHWWPRISRGICSAAHGLCVHLCYIGLWACDG